MSSTSYHLTEKSFTPHPARQYDFAHAIKHAELKAWCERFGQVFYASYIFRVLENAHIEAAIEHLSHRPRVNETDYWTVILFRVGGRTFALAVPIPLAEHKPEPLLLLNDPSDDQFALAVLRSINERVSDEVIRPFIVTEEDCQ